MAPFCAAATSGILCLLALPPPQHLHDGSKKKPLQLEVSASRRLEQTGLIAGGGMAVAALTVGIATDMFDPLFILSSTTLVGTALVLHSMSFNENRDPLPESEFAIQESIIDGAGMGLFALCNIDSGSYLFEYKGERLDENEYFQRYPDGQGRYVAEIPAAVPWGEPVYIDGMDARKSGLARWMNSKLDANVVWKKQRFGDGKMYFYAKRDIDAGEELCFDYGEQYWGAVRESE